jgi:hypothetical protein
MPPSRATSTLIPTSARSRFAGSMLALLIIATFPLTARSHDPDGSDPAPSFTHEEDTGLAEVGAKLSNPVSDVWALFTQFGLTWSDGDHNGGDPELGGNMIFQPILPVPLFGKEDARWQLITRPTIPILFGNSVPRKVPNRFRNETGIGDITLPLLVAPPTGDWLLGLGPNFLFPSSSQDAFGRQQWGIGPAGIVGYKTQDWVGGVFPQYYFGIGSRGDQGDKPDASYMSLLYFFFYNLPDAWQVGFNPSITYDDKATSGNKWNVPIGLAVAKTTKVAGKPVKFQFGAEYSIVSQDDFGQRFMLKLNIIPVIPSMIKNPIFGGN